MDSTTPVCEHVSCPFCGADRSEHWAEENGWTAVRCLDCGVVYLNPRPRLQSIDEAAQTGLHAVERGEGAETGRIDVTGTFSQRKVRDFQVRIREFFSDDELHRASLSWLDIGSGFGELLLALRDVAGNTVTLTGVEPNARKRQESINRGIPTAERLEQIRKPYNVISLMNVISHLPAPRRFFADLKELLNPGGSIVVLTGNGPDHSADELGIDALGFPDHLVFVEPRHLHRLFDELGFEVLLTKEYPSFYRESNIGRILKNAVKTVLGRPTRPDPGDLPYRDFVIRARLRTA